VNSEEEELLRELINRVAGQVGLAIYSLRPKKEFTDEQISQKLGIEINEIRRALFALYELGLVEYKRKKDDETGWMEYYWKLNYEKLKDVIKKELLKTLKNLESKVKSESLSVYYICVRGCLKVPYEVAMENNFICPQCGGVLEYLDNSSTMKKAKKEIEKIKEYLNLLSNTVF